MPLLDERPGQIYDSEDDSKKSSGGPEDGKGELSSSEGDAFDKIAANNPDLGKMESGASLSDGQKSASSKKEESVGKDLNYSGGKESKGNKGGLRGRVGNSFKSAKVKIGVAAATGSITIAIAGIFLAAPGFIMTHISTLITDKAGDLQSRQSQSFRRSKFAKFTDAFSIEGRRGGAVIQEMRKFGYEVDLDGTAISDIRRGGVSIDPANFDDEIATFIDDRYKILGQSTRSTRWKTKRMEAFWGRYKVPRSSIVAKTATDLDDPETEFNKRSFRNTDGQDNTSSRITALGEEPNRDDFGDDQAAYDQAKADYDKTISDIEGGSNSNFDPDKDKLANGADTGELSELGRSANGIEEGVVDPDLLDDGNIASTGFGFAKGVLVPTDIGDKMCTINNALNGAVKTARLVTSVKLMRAAMSFVGADDGQRRGEASADFVRELMKRVMVSDDALGGFASSSGYQNVANGQFSLNNARQTSSPFSTGRKLTGFYGGLEKSTRVPDPGCAVLQNAGFQVAQAVGIVAITIFTGGTGTLATQGGAAATRTAVTAGVKGLITRQALAGLARGFVAEYGFNQLINLGALYVQKRLEIPFTGQETGGRYASILFSGAGVLHKQRNARSGMIPATSRVFSQAHSEYLLELNAEKREKTFFARMFDMNTTESLAYKTTTQLAFQGLDPGQSAHKGAVNLASMPSLAASSFTSPISRMMVPQAYAQESSGLASFDTIEVNGTEFASDPYGNLELVMPEGLMAFADPAVSQENEAFLISQQHIDPVNKQPLSDELKDHIENCVDSPDTLSVMEESDLSNETDVTKDCMATQDLTLRFKGYLANVDTDDIFDAALFSEEINQGGLDAQLQVGNPTTDLNAPGLNGYAIPCEGIATPVIRVNDSDAPHVDWSARQSSGVLAGPDGNTINGTDGTPINIYVREACPGATNVKTVFIASSVHGSESGGQMVTHELLYNEDLPSNIRIIAVPEINKFGVFFRDNNGYGGRVNGEGVNLNRNFDYKWSDGNTGTTDSSSSNYKGPSVNSTPEAQALVAFINSLDIDLSLHYHDDINWVAAATNKTPIELARTYANNSPVPLRSAENGYHYTGGSFDGWMADSLNIPSLLIEMSPDQSQPTILEHVVAAKAVISGGGF